MGQGENLLYNAITLVFLVLTVLVAIMVISMATDSMEPPSFLAPEDTDVPATQYVPPTLTPSPAPGAELTPEMPPEATLPADSQ
jgi:Na+-transporting methylmalonyl-CoA/oxaloacetate decarboxylase gamma subunit